MSDNDILVYCEVNKEEIAPISTEALAAGRMLANATKGKVIGLAIGENARQIAEQAIQYGADECYTADIPELTAYHTEAYLSVFKTLQDSVAPEIILMGQTGVGRDIAPALAAYINGAATLDCVELTIDTTTGRLLMTKPVYGGNVWAVFETEYIPQIVTVRAKAFEALAPDKSRNGEILALDLKINLDAFRTQLIEIVPEQVEGIRLEDARVVVGGGRGIGSEAAFSKLEEIATTLNGTVGASRAACDNGWVLSTKQIGLTGKIVTPELYFAIGISGASQHMAGCSGSNHIIAINNDDGAYIFNEAHYGIIGDWEPVMNGFMNKLLELGAG